MNQRCWPRVLRGGPVAGAVLMAAMPMMGIYLILAQANGQEDFSAAALLVTTLGSFFTLSGLLWVFRHAPT